MSEVVQLDLSGETTDTPRRSPSTIVECDECGDRMLRSRRHDHEHDVEGNQSHVGGSNLKPEFRDASDESSGDVVDTGEQAEIVGHVYDVTLSYSVDYRFRIPAWSKHEAKDRAKDLELDARPVDSMLVHTDITEGKEIFEDDPELPDDFDPYDGTPLWEAYGSDGGGE